MIKVLVIDDSAFMRRLFTKTINNDPELKVIDTARNGKKGLKKIKDLNPDVITLDVEMPVKNGLETLEEIVKMDNPVQVIMVSAVDNRETVLTALDLGAFDFIPKPSGSISLNIEDIKENLIQKLKTAAKYKGNGIKDESVIKNPEPVTYKKSDKKTRNKNSKTKKDFPIIAVGSSSGGPKALKKFITAFPNNFPGAIIIVQHMPAGFTKSLADRLNQESNINVKEAEENDELKPGLALIAPGGKHLEIKENGKITLNEKETKWGVRPCVDYMMQTLAPVYKENIIGVILTGMGHDGAEGMEAIKDFNGYGIVEDKSTALVYGMPSSTIKKGAYDKILPLNKIPVQIIDLIERRF
ncbi:MAG: protein-glutamate methylesterase/protein-glutamine glutaminase [Bacillota bacterium]